jgi:hypothetical protein
MGQIGHSAVYFGSLCLDSDHLPYLLIYSYLTWYICICALYISFKPKPEECKTL